MKAFTRREMRQAMIVMVILGFLLGAAVVSLIWRLVVIS